MPRAFYGVSPIGLKHATRTRAVGERIASAGAVVRLFSGGVAADFLIKREDGDEHQDGRKDCQDAVDPFQVC